MPGNFNFCPIPVNCPVENILPNYILGTMTWQQIYFLDSKIQKVNNLTRVEVQCNTPLWLKALVMAI